ncbi:MAG: hypothetical protein HFG80_07895 [Eubacterium sp.]|jgi:hypothetical protein|nr:hypothetical protein [Eubacterium sp.]
MENVVTKYIANYIENSRFSVASISRILDIPENKLIPIPEEALTAEELLKLCSYLRINPESIPWNRKITG